MNRFGRLSKKSRDSKGMSLVEVVIALGVFGVLATVFASSFTEVFRSQKEIENKDISNDFSVALSRHIYKDQSCSSTLNGIRIPSDGSARNIDLRNYEGYGSNGNPITVSRGTTIGDNVRVKSLTLRNSGNPITNIKAEGVDYRRVTVKLEVQLEMQNQNGDWQESAPRQFELPVFTDNALNIQKCSVEMDMEDSCDVLGSNYNPATGLCDLQNGCSMMGSYIRNSCSFPNNGCPSGQPNLMTNGYSCPASSTPKPSGKYTWSFTESCGKKCSRTVTVSQRYFICLKCVQ